jgi:hypothetical protein
MATWHRDPALEIEAESKRGGVSARKRAKHSRSRSFGAYSSPRIRLRLAPLRFECKGEPSRRTHAPLSSPKQKVRSGSSTAVGKDGSRNEPLVQAVELT